MPLWSAYPSMESPNLLDVRVQTSNVNWPGWDTAVAVNWVAQGGFFCPPNWAMAEGRISRVSIFCNCNLVKESASCNLRNKYRQAILILGQKNQKSAQSNKQTNPSKPEKETKKSQNISFTSLKPSRMGNTRRAWETPKVVRQVILFP